MKILWLRIMTEKRYRGERESLEVRIKNLENEHFKNNRLNNAELANLLNENITLRKKCARYGVPL